MPREIFLDVPYVTQPAQTHRVALYEWGSNNTEVVFCVHGLTRNARDFDFLAERLSRSFRVISIDMPGRGNSEWLAHTAEYSPPHYIANLRFILEKLNIPACHWVGTSMGGILGMMMGALHPQRLHSLLLNDVGKIIPASGLKRLGEYVGKSVTFPTREAAETAYRKILTPFGISGDAQWAHMLSHSIEEHEGKWRARYDPAIAASLGGNPQDVDLRVLWKAVNCPVLLLRGETSDILPANIAQEMTQKKDVTLHTIPGCGHAPALMSEQQLMLVEEFLNRRPRARKLGLMKRVVRKIVGWALKHRR